MPMDPPITLVELKGSEVWDMIEENLERTFSRSAFGQMGGYLKRCAGMRTYFKVENPVGTRVQSIFVGDEPLDGERTYKAAYITSQAVPEKFGSNRMPGGKSLIEAVRTFLTTNRVAADPPSFVEV